MNHYAPVYRPVTPEAEAAALGAPSWAPKPTGDTTGVLDFAAVTAYIAASAPGDALHFHNGDYIFNQTPHMLQNRHYLGTGSVGSFGTKFKMADGANLDAVFAADMWFSASVTPAGEFPVTVRDILFDGNASNQTSGAGHGLVGMNFNAVIEDVKVVHTRGDGVRWSAYTLAGNVITSGTIGETHFIRVLTGDGTGDDIGGDGIRAIDSTNGLIPDCWLENCIPTGCVLNGIRVDSAKGWIVKGNHPSVNRMSAMKLGRGYKTIVIGNYCEGYGSSTTAGIYCGIDMSSSAIQGDGIVVNDNIIWANSDVIATSTCRGIAITADTNIVATNISVCGNVGVGRTDTLSTSGILLNCVNSGGSLEASVVGNNFAGFAVPYHIGTTGTVKVRGENSGGIVINETFSATPTIPSAKAAINGCWRMILTANVTSSTITAGVDGQTIVLQLVQDATGSRTFAWPANVTNPPTIASAANAVTRVSMQYIASTNTWTV